MARLELEAAVRDDSEIGSSAANRMRKDGVLPAVVYGLNRDSVAIKVDERTWDDLRRGMRGMAVIYLNVGNIEEPVLLKEIHRHPITRQPYNIDFLRVDLDKPIQVPVRVVVTAQPPELSVEEAFTQPTTEVLVECLPGEIPPVIELDASEVTMDSPLYVSDLEVGEKVTILTDPETAVATVVRAAQLIIEEEEEEEEEGLELAEGEEAPEGEEGEEGEAAEGEGDGDEE
jgi:large subunit ribosomal protein L25